MRDFRVVSVPRPPDRLPPPSGLSDELGPASTVALGLAPAVTWVRGPARLGVETTGIWAIGEGHRNEPTGEPFGWNVPCVECAACADGEPHVGYTSYQPARHYREIAADFLRLADDQGVLHFVRAWGLVRSHRLRGEAKDNLGSRSALVRWLAAVDRFSPEHDGQPDRIDDVLEWAERARRLHATAYALDDADRRSGWLEVNGVVRTMAVGFAPVINDAVELVPTSLLHYVFLALRGLYHGQSPLVCAEALLGACENALSLYEGQGRPRIYCSARCASRARNRRRRTAAKRPKPADSA